MIYSLDMVSDIQDGIKGVFNDIGAGILDFIITLISTLINLILYPIDALLKTIFPDFSSMIQIFDNALGLAITSPINYIMYHVPPLTKSVILFYITLLIGYYSIKYTYKAIILVPKIIQKIKFW